MIFLDTESIGFYGPTVLIQYAKDDGDITLWPIFDKPVRETISLIESIVDDTVCGFNLVHDWFHISKTYNVLKELPQNTLINPLDYADVEKLDECHDKYCLKPKSALDLLLYGKKTEFQSVLNQKDITIRRVPRVMVEQLVHDLFENIKIPEIYFSKSTIGYHWIIANLDKEGKETQEENNSEFVNLKLRFNPSASLKSIMKSLGHEVTELEDLDELDRLPNLKQIDCGWFPCNGEWTKVFARYIFAWRNNKKRLEYATNDVKYLRILYNHFGSPSAGDVDSLLACAVGSMYWKGFEIDKDNARNHYKYISNIINNFSKINFNSPLQVKKWLHEVASPLEQQVIKDTKSETLQTIIDDWPQSELTNRCKSILEVRRVDMEATFIERILTAGRMYVMTKVIGTKSNRMSGGAENYIKSNGSINPQGIKKGSIIRGMIKLAKEPLILCGGDFDAFEVSIADAEYNDNGLRSDLLSGKKIHAIFGAEMYNLTYEEVYNTKELNKNEPNGYYSRAKTGFFGTLYGAQKQKLAKSMQISEEEAAAGLERFFKKYPGVKVAQQKVINSLTCLTQPEGIGTRVIWKEPFRYVESFFGFKRHFDLEFSIIRALFDMASNPSEGLKNNGSRIKVIRRDRTQTATGAVVSALYALAFNLNSAVIRAGINHRIQSPGGQATKLLQSKIWEIQPVGINDWYVMPLNIHDEIECPTLPVVIEKVKIVVDNCVKELSKHIPLVKMEWKTNLKNWGEK